MVTFLKYHLVNVKSIATTEENKVFKELLNLKLTLNFKKCEVVAFF